MFKKEWDNLKQNGALVHCITNYVTVNDVANMLIACGAAPIMADDVNEVEEITAICDGLNINIGTLNERTIESMLLAGKKSNQLKHPVLLDPVGAGASKLRTQTAKALLEKLDIAVVRGNISEIKALFLKENKTKGVDASDLDMISEENLDEAIAIAKAFSKESNAIIAITGAIDIVANSERAFILKNGCQEMSRITGSGCMLSAVITAFVSANKESKLEATALAILAMTVAGEIAKERSNEQDGNSSYRNYLIDALDNLTFEELSRRIKYETK